MQAALFHVTRVRDASEMVFAKLLQLLLLFFWLRARRRRRIRAKRRRLSSWDHAFTASASLRWRSTARTTAAVCARILEGSRINRQLWVRPRSSSFYQDTVQGWSDAEFKGNFRVSRPTFAYLVSELKPTLERQDFPRSSIPADQRIAITLWRLGTNVEYRTISHLFGVGLSTVCVLVHQVCQAIVEKLAPRYIKLPNDDSIQTIVDGFLHRWQFPQCAGAIDGSHIPILAPTLNSKDYVNRKNFHSIVLQAVVDHHCRFLDIYIGWPGSTHDARVLANSSIYIKAEAGTLFPNKERQICGQNIPLLMLGDPAYPLLHWLMKPYSQSGPLTQKQRKFNYQLSRARIVTEIAFGRLKGRWRCLLKRNDTAQKYLIQQVAACCALHNICEVHMDGFDESWQIDASATSSAGPSPQLMSSSANGVAIRDALANYFETH